MMGHALLDGNGYSYITRDEAARPIQLTLLAPRQVTPIRVNGVLWYVYQFIDGEMLKFPATDILHIKGFSYDGLIGYNLVHKARESLGLGLAIETYGGIFFRNNARPNIVLQAPHRLSDKAKQNLRESWERLHAGLENAHRTAILEEGLQAKEMTITAEAAQLIEQKKFSLTDVANWLGIPVHKVGGEGRTAYNSLEQENQSYLDEGLDPWLLKWEEECRDKLLTEYQKKRMTHRVWFDRSQLLRANQASRGDFYTKMLTAGVITVDEARAEEGKNPLPDGAGEITYHPANMTVVPVGPEPDEDEATPADAADLGKELLDLEDVRQPTHWSCGAAAAMATGRYFGKGPVTIEEWIEALGTDLAQSTDPMRIVAYLSSLGLAVTACHDLTVDDLREFWKKGMPVICCVQDWGDRRGRGPTSFTGITSQSSAWRWGWSFARTVPRTT
jgi:HK97 family phage portal protein